MPIYRGTRLSLLGKNLISYLLRARFGVPDQGYADAQVLDTKAEGVEVGQLTVVEVDGTLAIVSNECAFTAQGTPTWGDQGFYSQAITKALGRGLICTLNLSTWEEMGIGWDNAGVVDDPDNMIYALQANTADGQIDVESGTAILTSLSTGTDYRLAIVLGGYDSSAVPWRSGQVAASYLYGAAYFYHDGINWYLLWRKSTDNTATIYAAMTSLDAAGTLDHFRVPDVDLSAVLQPQALSTFTAANGTSLDAITPEVGGLWTEQSGDFDIQGNKTRCTATSNATCDGGVADCHVIADATPYSTDASNQVVPYLLLRYTDETHYWALGINADSNLIVLYENDAGFTLRASAAVAINSAQEYRVMGICYGQDIDGFVDGGTKINYGSAALNVTAETHGIRAPVSGTPPGDVTFDNFAIFSRTSAAYDTALDAV